MSLTEKELYDICFWCNNTLLVIFLYWRDGRVDDYTNLENWRSWKRPGGSNPSLSAKYTG